MAEGFIERGHTVAGCGRSRTGIAALSKQHGSPHLFRVVDVTSDDEVAAWAKEVIGALGAPDFLLNNAAIINRNAPLWEVPAADFSAIVDVNIKGVVNVIRHFVPAMVKRKKGIIENFSSGWGRSTDAEVAPYCATKWAIEGLSQAMGQELPEGMGVVALNPGIIDTDMLRSSFGGSAGSYPPPQQWAKRAVPYILGITPENAHERTTVS
jgi:NAD(P)-dependent dehydrogenase (short-subunit alcohol dehydrogenase family)